MKITTNEDYYEAILQLRPSRTDVIDFVVEMLKKRGVKVTKIIEIKTGIDLYITDQKFARTVLAKQLKKKFKGTITISKKLYGKNRMSSRLVYRATVLFRLKE